MKNDFFFGSDKEWVDTLGLLNLVTPSWIWIPFPSKLGLAPKTKRKIGNILFNPLFSLIYSLLTAWRVEKRTHRLFDDTSLAEYGGHRFVFLQLNRHKRWPQTRSFEATQDSRSRHSRAEQCFIFQGTVHSDFFFIKFVILALLFALSF